MAEAESSSPAHRERPLSPHMQVWRWHITMATSIMTRASGVALYVGALIIAGWALALASGPVAFDRYVILLGSFPGKLILFGLTLAIFYHLAAGIRHLFWDAGEGFELKTADMTAAAAIAFAIVATAGVWFIAMMSGVL